MASVEGIALFDLVNYAVLIFSVCSIAHIMAILSWDGPFEICLEGDEKRYPAYFHKLAHRLTASYFLVIFLL
jgi:hypothetical protein